MKTSGHSTVGVQAARMGQKRQRAPSWACQPKTTPRDWDTILITGQGPGGRGGCPWHFLPRCTLLLATANWQQHHKAQQGKGGGDRRGQMWERMDMWGLFWLCRKAGKGRRWWQRHRRKHFFNRETKIRNPRREKYHREQDHSASSSNGSWVQEGPHNSPTQRLWHKRSEGAHWWHDSRRRRRHHRCMKPLHQARAGGQSSPREALQHRPPPRNQQPQTIHIARKCYHSFSLGLQQPCEPATGSSGRVLCSPPLWNVKKHCWADRSHVLPELLQEMTRYLRPMNMAGYCLLGMCAPHNTSQYIMDQHLDTWKNKQEEAVAMSRENSIDSIMDENSLTAPLPSIVQNEGDISTKEEEDKKEKSMQLTYEDWKCKADIHHET